MIEGQKVIKVFSHEYKAIDEFKKYMNKLMEGTYYQIYTGKTKNN